MFEITKFAIDLSIGAAILVLAGILLALVIDATSGIWLAVF